MKKIITLISFFCFLEISETYSIDIATQKITSEINTCDYADLCSDITEVNTLFPESPDNENESPVPYCQSSCLDNANPETFEVNGCSFTSNPVVWHKVIIDVNAQILNIVVTTTEWTGAISLFEGSSCDQITLIGSCTMGIPGAILSPGNTIHPTNSYWIAISYISGSTADLSYDICVTSTPSYAECSIEQSITVAKRSNDPNGDLGLSLDGPFCLGETISICYDLNFDPSESNCQWFQGIVPKFGNAWDFTSFDPNSNLPTPGGGWNWYSEGDVLYQEANPFLCVYNDTNGKLNLCHYIYESCPCSEGIQGDTPLPAGWFYYSPGNGASCTNTGHPNSGWGFPQGCTAIVHFQVCFDITVKTYNTQLDCEEEMDLSITFYPFADGETGCWGDTKCAGDVPERKTFQIDCDQYSTVEADSLITLCSGEITDISLIANSPDVSIQWSVINEPNYIEGDENGIIDTNITSLMQELINTDSIIHEVIYEITAVNQESNCASTISSIVSVKVLPSSNATIEIPIMLGCQVDTVKLIAQISGNPDNYNFNWSTENGVIVSALNLQEITIINEGNYNLIVTDYNSGCISTATIEVEMIEFAPTPKIEIENGSDSYTFEFSGIVLGHTESWYWDFGDDHNSNEQSPNHQFEEEGFYQVCLTTENGCGSNEYCIELSVPSSLDLGYNYHKSDLECYGATTGLIELFPTGGEGPYTVTWTGPNGAMFSDLYIDGLETGDYIFVLTDENQDVITNIIHINSPMEITAEAIIQNETSIQNDGSIDISVSGGTAPYTYLWSNGELTEDISDLAAGSYYVVVLDANNCLQTITGFIVQTQTATQSISSINNINLYPIPAANQLTLAMELNTLEQFQYQILGKDGKLISNGKLKYQSVISESIDISDLSNGVYFLIIESNSGKMPIEFVVIK